MIFTIAVNLAFAFLGPLGSASVVVADWMFNSYLVAKAVETFVPNGQAIVGNISQLFPVLLNTAYSASLPILTANYSGFLKENMPDLDLQALQGNFTTLFEQVRNISVALQGE